MNSSPFNNPTSLFTRICHLSLPSSHLIAIRSSSACFCIGKSIPKFCFSRSRLFSVLSSYTFMEVVKSAAKHGATCRESVAIRANQKSHSYIQLISSALKISDLLTSSDLRTGHGHLGGAKIGIVAKPSAEFLAGVLGTWFSGGVAVPLALSYPEAELLHVLNDSEVSMILSTEDHVEFMQSVAAKTVAIVSLIPPVPHIYSERNSHDQSTNIEVNAADADRVFQGTVENLSDDPALIIYTSGTTGKPKGVVHTHKSITSQVQTLSNAWEYTSADQFLHCLPLHHVHGMFNGLLAPIYAGSTVEFMPKFSVSGIWKRWRESYPSKSSKSDDAITVFTGVPTMYARLLQGYEAMDSELQLASASAARQLRLMMCGSSALPPPIMKQWREVTGHELLERYGMTEAKIVADDGSTTGSSLEGELCIRSPSMFKEYWKLPKVTKESFIDGGFFKTGDAARLDEDGYYIILGRLSADIMKVGGYKLSALEIESVILQHPSVTECCVLGLPDKDYGERVCAIVVLQANTKTTIPDGSNPSMSLDELRTWAKDKLAPYKLPTMLLLKDSLPRNAMGKVNKKELKKKLIAEE
ncbi:probable CoA ligase CCL8 isoform X2 [Cucumis melo]|uniref:Probable CoA ligase CCL8 isoform X2 n=1 Tax=Cucumis melo TaxID=3656 RepID=A0ABM3KY62_CUCME|nr:probable CoA ligase CCL8 isoform X2 [Cucumis melo]